VSNYGIVIKMVSKISSAKNYFADLGSGFKHTIQKEDYNGSQLCHECKKIPFKEFSSHYADSPPGSSSSSPSTSSFSSGASITLDRKPKTYCLSLDKVLSHRKWCKFCALLFETICRSEYDVFKSEHIQKHLGTSEKLKNIQTFSQWASAFSRWEKLTESQDIWPFGYTADQKEAQADAEATARNLFQTAEEKDLNSGVLDGMYNTTDDLNTSLQVVAFATGIANIGIGDEYLAGIQLLASQMALLGIGKAKKLPCLFLIRPYHWDEAKAGVMSVRVYAHGRGFHSPLSELTHFSYRTNQPIPRPEGQQLWYGRSLGPRIDMPFFEKCLVACQQLHGEGCNKSTWHRSLASGANDSFPFWLINVKTMCVVEKDFQRALTPPNDPRHISFAILSYTWGASEWTEHTDGFGKSCVSLSTSHC
jgi:hypothetical protein